MTQPLSGLKKLSLAPRRRESVSSTDWVRTEPFSADSEFLRRLEPTVDGVSLVKWAEQNRSRIDSLLQRHGGILFRGFSVTSAEAFEDLVRALAGDLMEYTYRSTPRTEVQGRVYTSTEYPADRSIPMHNEMSYAAEWPMRIAFFCAEPATTGGATPLADSRRVYESIDPRVRSRFARLGVLYVRNYSPGLDVPWQDVFQTADQAEVERFCSNSGIEIEWKPDGGLRTRQVCKAVRSHPVTGQAIWFNQAHLFHASSLDAKTSQALLIERGGEEELPRNTYYGDGTPIELEVLDHIREVYNTEMVDVAWRKGDLVLLDNMLTAHGRAPFSGPRKVLVAMADTAGDRS